MKVHYFTKSSENKKLCYRKEHIASVVLGCCTLWHFSVKNLLMALPAKFRTTGIPL